MSLSEIISKSLKYPVSDYKKFLIVGIISLLAGLNEIFGENLSLSLSLILIIIQIIFAIILSGYAIGVIGEGLKESNFIPNLNISKNFIDGLKTIIISIAYLIIPTLIVVIVGFITGVIGAGLNAFSQSLLVVIVLAVILYILFGILEVSALVKFAKYDDFNEALKFKEVFEDAKSVGIGKLIGFLIILAILEIIIFLIALLVCLIPYIGVIIAAILTGGFNLLFSNYALGLFFSEI